MFKVNEVIRASAGKLIQGDPDGKIAGISTDSRSPIPQGAFLALRGKNFDGHDYIAEAVKTRPAV